ncbi:beta-taxilin isoform X2 [Neoarius graeffei]|uniref:beta-taxilin isoform X2 n=1 Tax=Neoarius graeffei TaxID=443677 RepID=UPI00298D169D|nr:beta-taxilin isoform X2 [Neoarius graeffei]
MESSSQPSADTGEQVSGLEEKPVDPMEVFSKQLEDIINTYGSACSLLEEKIAILEEDEEKLDEETMAKDLAANTGVCSSPETEQTASMLLEGLGKEALLLLQSLKDIISPEEKLETVLRKYAELLKEQRDEQVELKMLQKKQGLLIKQRDQLQLDHSQGILARSKLESLCHELQKHNKTLKEDMLQKYQEDEKKRAEITSHFQNTVVDIQAQIEHHSNRNNKLCQENSELANKLTSIIQQYEKREESLEKIFKQKNLQQQLSDAKLEEANMRLKEAEEKHKREKEYLLTHAAEWKLQVKELKEQNTVMQAQLVLYSQKFDEFQATLAKSNEVYTVFKQEMEKMTKKMKKLERESNVWKIRFESCSKALTDMIEERSEKGKELELFTVKIDKLEMLCRALQEERKVLYGKIKELRLQVISASVPVADIVEEEIPELAQLPISESVQNPALTVEMEKLWKEQARLQEFAASLLASTADDMVGSDSEEESSEPTQLPLVPVLSKPSTVKLDSITEEHGLEEGIKEVCKSETTLTPEALKSEEIKFEAKHESNQHDKEPSKAEPSKAEPPKVELPKVEPPKEEPPKEEPPKVEPPKEEPPKVELPKVEPPKEEPPKVELPKVEPPKEEPPKVEPPKEEPPKVEPPKEESPKVEPPKEEPPKVEPPKEEPPKVEPPKEEPPKVEPPKEEPPKVEPPKEEPPKVQPPKEEPPKVEPLKEEPPKVEPLKAEPPKEEPPKEVPPKMEPPKEEPLKVVLPKAEPPKEEPPKAETSQEKLTKVPARNVAKVEPIKQDTPRQKSNKPNSVDLKETKPKEMKRVTVHPEAPKVNPIKNEFDTELDPKAETTKQTLSAKEEPIQVESHIAEPPAPKASTAGAAKPQNAKSQEAKSNASKSHAKKQGSSKKKGSAKSAKKS